MSDRYPMTVIGHQKLLDELDDLKKNQRPAVIDAIAVARAHGDLSENAEYHAAREKQSFIEGRILELDAKTGRAQVIDPKTLSGNKVVFGVTVTVIDEDTEEEKTFQIVGEDEADIKSGLMSYTSPIARALIGKDVGDSVDVQAPKGVQTYEILEVEFK